MGTHWNGPRIPPPTDGIQVNFCKNPLCSNFGISPSIERQPRGKLTGDKSARDTYIRGKKNGTPTIKCQLCGRTTYLKSNLAVVEEFKRISESLALPRINDRCPNPACDNKTPVDEWPFHNYQRFGTTKKGSERFRCKTCNKTFSIPYPSLQSPHARQKVHGFKNIEIFRELVNRVPLNSICRLRDIPFKLLIDKIKFIHRQCRLFSAQREAKIRELVFDDLYLSVDRQVYNVNWSQASDRRNTALMAIGTAERYSGYVFGMHLNFDPSVNVLGVNKEAVDIGDTSIPIPFRRFARLWLKDDYAIKDLDTGIDHVADVAPLETEAIEEDAPNSERKLPDKGVQIRAEYTMHGHFRHIKSLLPSVKRFVFYLDDESGIDSALFAAFTEEVRDKRCEGFIVKINKDLTIIEKRKVKRAADRELQKLVPNNPSYEMLSLMSLQQIYLEKIIKDEMSKGILKNKTLQYPFPNMSEPEKLVRWLTDLEGVHGLKQVK